jgi:hypothetical protein
VKRLFPLILLTACTASRLTHSRDSLRGCWAADPNLIACGGKRVAVVECFAPGDEACGALAVHYTDGERVFLWRPPGFEPGQPSAEASLRHGAVLRPELASDAQMIWFRPANAGNEFWTVYEPRTGITRQVDSYTIFKIRENDPHSMPLWVNTAQTMQ